MERIIHTKYTRLMLLILAVVLLFASIAGYLVSVRIQSNSQAGSTTSPIPNLQSPISSLSLPSPTLIPYPTKGSFVLTEQSGLTSVQSGTPFTLNLIATSANNTVAGYDVILSYDTTSLKRQSIQNKASDFRIFTYDRGSHLSLSATKNLEVTTPIQFTNTPILSLTFVGKQKGTYVFSLKPVGSESSKLVNESAQVTYPAVSDFRIEIR